MKKIKLFAVHEAGHAVIAHYGGLKVKSLSLNQDGGDAEIGTPDGSKHVQIEGVTAIGISVAGFMAEFLECGAVDFWKLHPKSELMKTLDMQKLMSFNLNHQTSKTKARKLFFDIQNYISTPIIWGKILWLTEELIDHPKDLENIDSLIATCHRLRTPEHDSAPLIEFVVNELFNSAQPFHRGLKL